MTKEDCLKLVESKFWEHLTAKEVALFQLKEDKLCMPFNKFHEAVEKALGRPVSTHEFALNREGMIEELEGDKPALTFQKILDLIPKDKKVIIAEV